MFYIFFSFQREISELHFPIGVKFCKMIRPQTNFLMPVQIFLGLSPQI